MPPIAPASIREKWPDIQLPEWMTADLGLGPGATLSALEMDSTGLGELAADRVTHFLAWLVTTRFEELRNDRVLKRGTALPEALEDLGLKVKTLNCLKRVGYHRKLTELALATYGDLLQIPTMGAVSVLDYACKAEERGKAAPSAVDYRSAPEPERPEQTGTQVEALLDGFSALRGAGRISRADRRFTLAIPPELEGWRPGDPSWNPALALEVSAEDLVGALTESLRIAREIAALPLETALEEFARRLTGINDHRLGPMLRRLQWTGEPQAAILEIAGKDAGITRERMRQLTNKVRERILPEPIFMPRLDEAIETLVARAPISALVAADVLPSLGITKGRFHPSSVLAAARALHIEAPFSIENLDGEDFVVVESLAAKLGIVLRVAKRLAVAAGAVHVDRIISSAEREYAVSLTAAEIRELLTTHTDFIPLDDEPSWYRLPPQYQDALTTVVRKVLSATASVDVPTLRDAASRFFRFRRSSTPSGKRWEPYPPPRSVLEAFLRRSPEFTVSDDGIVSATAPFSPLDQLPGLELQLMGVLRSEPTQFLDRGKLLAECARRGMSASSVAVALSYSPIIANPAGRFWCVRGTRIDPVVLKDAIEDLESRGRVRRTLDYGWTPDGGIWIEAIAHDVSANPSSLFHVPSPVRRYLEGREYNAVAEDGTPCGTLKVTDQAAYGIAPYLRMVGAEEGDVLRITFDLRASTARLEIGEADNFMED